MQQEPYGEVFLLDKPLQWTSFDVVKKIRNTLKIKKVGHAGTLDPLATGLLIVCAGKMTKQIESFMGQEKEYVGTFVLGSTTESFDLEKHISPVADPSHLKLHHIQGAVAQLTGSILQVPPMHSAIKIGGKRAYSAARKGEELELQSRAIEVREFEITRFEQGEVDFRISCSKGTYIRSLARDLGQLLGVGAYLKSLRRTRIGSFTLEQAKKIEEVVEQVTARENENLRRLS